MWWFARVADGCDGWNVVHNGQRAWLWCAGLNLVHGRAPDYLWQRLASVIMTFVVPLLLCFACDNWGSALMARVAGEGFNSIYGSSTLRY